VEKSIFQMANEIQAATASVAQMQEQMKRASENREAENADYQQTVTDQRLTQMILQKAVERLKQVYAAFLERQPGAPHIQTSGNHTDPGNGPARFTKYNKHVGGSRVVQMLATIMADSRQTEDDAIVAEEQSQAAYENFMKDSNKAIHAYTSKVMNLSGAKAKAEEELIMAHSDMQATMEELEGLHAVVGRLKSSCDFIIKNFSARQGGRMAEMNALREAKSILAGGK